MIVVVTINTIYRQNPDGVTLLWLKNVNHK